jgi:hypothetical protein
MTDREDSRDAPRRRRSGDRGATAGGGGGTGGTGRGRSAGEDRPRRAAGASRSPRRGAAGTARGDLEKRAYDPRREERRKASRVALPEGVEARMLDPEARQELRTLSKDTADLVARHLVVTGELLDVDPGQALAHARAARAMAGRVAVVREAAGLAAYAAEEWSEALAELRAARRISGRPDHLAMFADCERALGRPERALGYADDPDLPRLSQEERVELVIVLAGARRDLGQYDAAVLTLQDPARRTAAARPWAPRLWYAYADALLAAGREEEARTWFSKTAGADAEGETDAVDRLLALEGVVLEGLDGDENGDGDESGDRGGGEGADRPDLPSDAELADYVRGMAAPRGGADPGGR